MFIIISGRFLTTSHECDCFPSSHRYDCRNTFRLLSSWCSSNADTSVGRPRVGGAMSSLSTNRHQFGQQQVSFYFSGNTQSMRFKSAMKAVRVLPGVSFAWWASFVVSMTAKWQLMCHFDTEIRPTLTNYNCDAYTTEKGRVIWISKDNAGVPAQGQRGIFWWARRFLSRADGLRSHLERVRFLWVWDDLHLLRKGNVVSTRVLQRVQETVPLVAERKYIWTIRNRKRPCLRFRVQLFHRKRPVRGDGFALGPWRWDCAKVSGSRLRTDRHVHRSPKQGDGGDARLC